MVKITEAQSRANYEEQLQIMENKARLDEAALRQRITEDEGPTTKGLPNYSKLNKATVLPCASESGRQVELDGDTLNTVVDDRPLEPSHLTQEVLPPAAKLAAVSLQREPATPRKPRSKAKAPGTPISETPQAPAPKVDLPQIPVLYDLGAHGTMSALYNRVFTDEANTMLILCRGLSVGLGAVYNPPMGTPMTVRVGDAQDRLDVVIGPTFVDDLCQDRKLLLFLRPPQAAEEEDEEIETWG